MSRANLALRWIFITAWLILAPQHANAFKELTAPASALRQRGGENPRTVVFDNDYLDRRFGRSGVPETTRNGNTDTITSERGVSPVLPPTENRTIDVLPKRSSEVSLNRSLLPAIKRDTPARRAAALRLAEAGRMHLQKGQKRKAVYYLEKALSMDANPFIHFYLARAHYQLADYQGSLGFLEVAESGFYGHPDWLLELETLRSELSVHYYTPPAVATRTVRWTFNE